MYNEVLDFWFKETQPRMWWVSDPEFDQQIRERFLPLLQQAARAELFAWRKEPRGRLAEIVVLDQFSRNIYRNTPAAFTQDSMALVLAQEAVGAEVHEVLAPVERGFLLLPFMHSESTLIHVQAENLYREHALRDNYEFELKHKAIIDRFGRYPHRNQILGRVSTTEEIEFLQQPGSKF
ncbi:MAG: DUF924 domain-containing protein [Pseudomonadales bacterium]|nr:DUF924 domain-containing protein [Pseudomonadales bacterium]